MNHKSKLRPLGALTLAGLLLGACNTEKPKPSKARHDDPQPSEQPARAQPTPRAEPPAEPVDPALTGEQAHVIPFADRTSMGYLLLLPPGTKQPKAPTREHLKTLVEQAFPDRQRDG